MKRYIAFLHILMFFYFFSSCIDKEEWLAQNNNRPTSKSDITNNSGSDTSQVSTDFVKEYVVNEQVRDYDTITLCVKSNTSITHVYMPDVKYNLKSVVVFISQGMASADLIRGWALFNGYPVGKKESMYSCNFINVLAGQEGLGTEMDIHEPYVYDTDDGKSKRWAMTTAINTSWYKETNYSRINAYDAKGMMRTGHSFQLQNFTSSVINPSLEELVEIISNESNKWKVITGIGTKMIIEPNNDMTHMEVAHMSNNICLPICQSTYTGYLHSYMGKTYYSSWQQADDDEKVTYNTISKDLSEWANGNAVSEYSHKSRNVLIRNFDSEGTVMQAVTNQLNQGLKKLNLFSANGTSSEKVNLFKSLHELDGLWVTSIDDFWEYYYLKKHTKITIVQEDSVTKITLLVPQYPNHQFRDFTLDLDATDVTDVTFSSNVVTSGWRQNDGYCTINVGLETRMYKYITEYLNIAYKYPKSTCMQRDIEYLIGLLADGEMKDQYQALCNKIFGNK